MNSAYEIKRLRARVGWAAVWVPRTTRWALRCPVWVPGPVRRLPLTLCCQLARVELWRMRHGL